MTEYSLRLIYGTDVAQVTARPPLSEEIIRKLGSDVVNTGNLEILRPTGATSILLYALAGYPDQMAHNLLLDVTGVLTSEGHQVAYEASYDAR